ncbi:GNAT family N-acetyltransferase [Wenxinia saemankumensis]|uniref:GNAT family N-acetyltransferase n=1 Tax=Wenxinia saemankumensis TaxID=1447782 RepID=UPI001FCDB331|nr:GNAT family N-acetyltransferase [Wenxinia saemankumensis]
MRVIGDEDGPVRRARPEDLPALAALVGGLAAHHGDPAVADAAALERDIFDPAPLYRAWVACHGGAVAGYALALPAGQAQSGRRGLDLHHLFVAPGARGHGLGRALVAAVEARARQEGGCYVRIGAARSNVLAHALYRALGYEERAGDPSFRKRLD